MEVPNTDVVVQYRRHQTWSMSPEERVRKSAEINEAAMQILKSNPPAYRAFLERNYRKRRAGGEQAMKFTDSLCQ